MAESETNCEQIIRDINAFLDDGSKGYLPLQFELEDDLGKVHVVFFGINSELPVGLVTGATADTDISNMIEQTKQEEQRLFAKLSKDGIKLYRSGLSTDSIKTVVEVIETGEYFSDISATEIKPGEQIAISQIED
jgi:hypothetical protein